MKREHENVVELAKILAQNDTSWKNTSKPGGDQLNPSIISVTDPTEPAEDISIDTQSPSKQAQEKYDKYESETIPDVYKTDKKKFRNTDETPLLLAARNGCIEMVKEILDVSPQAVEYLNKNGQNLLHVAAENVHSNIIEFVRHKNLHFNGLMSCIDDGGNSILHMLGSNKEALVDVKMDNPAVQLSQKLLLLEHLKDICPRKLANYHNHEMMTADELFAFNNEELRKEAKDWLKRTAEQCNKVILLIVTLAFTAAYTVPGGPNQSTGMPLLLRQPFFLVFTLTDVLSLAFALTTVVIFLSIRTSSFQFEDFKTSLPQKLLLGLSLLFLSVSMMMLSFATTIIIMIHNKGIWTHIAIDVVALFPISIFMLSYIPIYIQLVNAFKSWVIKISKYLPRCKVSPRLSAGSNNSASSSCAADDHSV